MCWSRSARKRFPWIERDCGIEFDKWNMPQSMPRPSPPPTQRCSSAATRRLAQEHHLGGGARPRRRTFDPQDVLRRGHHRAPASGSECLVAEDGHPRVELRQRRLQRQALQGAASRQGDCTQDIRTEVELGYDVKLALGEAQRCLNCDIQTVFSAPACIECDACVDICPMDCITFTANGEEEDCGSG